MFDTWKTEGEFGNLKIDNNKKEKIESVGRVCLKLHNTVVQTLQNIRFENMTSLSTQCKKYLT